MIPLHDDNPTHIVPWVTYGLIAACVLAFLWQLSLPETAGHTAVFRFGVIPAVLSGQAGLPSEIAPVPPVATILSSMFLHGGLMHLGGNMLYLWIFGNNIEDAMGHGRFAAFYVLCGAAAAIAQVLQNPGSTIPMIGASGAISGVLGGYLLLYPHARVLVAIPLGFIIQTLRLPAVWVLGAWFVLQIVSSAMAAPGKPGVAWFAHIGGFVAGLILIPIFKYRHVALWQGKSAERLPP